MLVTASLLSVSQRWIKSNSEHVIWCIVPGSQLVMCSAGLAEKKVCIDGGQLKKKEGLSVRQLETNKAAEVLCGRAAIQECG